MLDSHQKFRMMDENKKHNFFIEVNWEENNERINSCKILKFTFPNKDEAFVRREYLNELLFAIGNPSEQRKMVPQVTETVHWRKTVLGVKATKDVKKGEMINFPIEISFPCGNPKEFIGELKKSEKHKKDIKL